MCLLEIVLYSTRDIWGKHQENQNKGEKAERKLTPGE